MSMYVCDKECEPSGESGQSSRQLPLIWESCHVSAARRARGTEPSHRIGGSSREPDTPAMSLTYAERTKARGMLADKQGIGSIAEELECSPAEIQALADAKPKAVS